MSDEPRCNLLGPTSYPYRCTKPWGHDGDHGYAGCFWSAPRPAHPATMIGRQ